MTADVLFYLGPIPVSNSMLTCWVISLSLILVLRLIGGQPKLIPGKGQLVLETIIGGLRSVIEPIVGKKVFFPSFGLLSGLFFFILINNWSGLLPGVGTIGFGSQIGVMLATFSFKVGARCGVIPFFLLGLCSFSVFWPSWPPLGAIWARILDGLGLDFGRFFGSILEGFELYFGSF